MQLSMTKTVNFFIFTANFCLDLPTKHQDASNRVEFTEEEVGVSAAMAKHEVDLLFNRTEPQLIEEFRRTNFRYSTLAWNELLAQNEKSKQLSYPALASVFTAQRLNG
jgi:hypothetical protein